MKAHEFGTMNEDDACAVTCKDCGLIHYWWEREPTEPECLPGSVVVEKWVEAGPIIARHFQYEQSPMRRGLSQPQPWWNSVKLDIKR